MAPRGRGRPQTRFWSPDLPRTPSPREHSRGRGCPLNCCCGNKSPPPPRSASPVPHSALAAPWLPGIHALPRLDRIPPAWALAAPFLRCPERMGGPPVKANPAAAAPGGAESGKEQGLGGRGETAVGAGRRGPLESALRWRPLLPAPPNLPVGRRDRWGSSGFAPGLAPASATLPGPPAPRGRARRRGLLPGAHALPPSPSPRAGRYLGWSGSAWTTARTWTSAAGPSSSPAPARAACPTCPSSSSGPRAAPASSGPGWGSTRRPARS